MPESRWKQKKTQINFKMHVNNTVCHIHDSICKNCNLHLIPFSKWDVQCISVVFIGCYQTLQDQSGLFFFCGQVLYWINILLLTQKPVEVFKNCKKICQHIHKLYSIFFQSGGLVSWSRMGSCPYIPMDQLNMANTTSTIGMP